MGELHRDADKGGPWPCLILKPFPPECQKAWSEYLATGLAVPHVGKAPSSFIRHQKFIDSSKVIAMISSCSWKWNHFLLLLDCRLSLLFPRNLKKDYGMNRSKFKQTHCLCRNPTYELSWLGFNTTELIKGHIKIKHQDNWSCQGGKTKDFCT